MNYTNRLYRLAALLMAGVFSPATALAVPSVEAAIVTPAQITVGIPTDILVTARVSSGAGDPAVIPTGVNLLRLSETGSSQIILGTMRDDGTLGDSTAGDGVFSLRLTLNEPVVGQVNLRVSAAFRGMLKRVLSPVSTLAVIEAVSLTVPNLFGLTQAEAEERLHQASLGLGAVSEAYRIFTKSGLIVGQLPAPGTSVGEGAVVDLLVVRPPPVGANETFPDAWTGRWKITVAYRDAETDVIDSVVEIVDDICPGDPIGLALVEQVAGENPEVTDASCLGQAAVDRISASCAGRIENPACNADLKASAELALTGESIVGIGSWMTTDSCGLPVPTHGQVFTISGTRLGPVEDGFCTKRNAFLQKFLNNPLLAKVGGAP